MSIEVRLCSEVMVIPPSTVVIDCISALSCCDVIPELEIVTDDTTVNPAVRATTASI